MAAVKARATNEDEREWQARCDMRSLIEAEKIRKDAKRMAAVRKIAQKELAEVAMLAQDTEGGKA